MTNEDRLELHRWAAAKLRELIKRLRVGIQLGTPIPYGDKE